MKSLLFIGGTGFLGQSFFDYINEGHLKTLKLSQIIIISRKLKKIKSKIKIKFIKKNIKNIKKIPVTDFIIYGANSSNNKENLDGFYNFKNLLTKKHLNTKILFTSSGAVYGTRKIKKKMKENDSLSITNINKFRGYKKNYAKTKIILENEFKTLSKKGFNVSIARLFSFIGKRVLINKNFAITDLINQAKNQKKTTINLYDNRHVYRGYMDSKDLIKWLVKILINSNKECKIFNVGSDEVVTIKKLAKLISQRYNKQVKYNYKFTLLKNNKNIDYYVPSILKAKKKLNLKLSYNFNKSLNYLIKNF